MPTPNEDDKPKPTKRIAIAIELDYAYPWHYDCYQGILEYAEQHGWMCIVDPFLVGVTDNEEPPYDGVVGRIDQETADIAASIGIPAVNHWANAPDHSLPSMLMDDIAVGRLTGEHLITCGYRRFAFAGIHHNKPGDLQLQGFTQAVIAKGFQSPDVWMYDARFEEDRQLLTSFRRGLIDWLSGMEKPIGLAAINASAARYVVQICNELGMDVPRDVGIVVQSSDYSSDTGTPSITSVEQDYMKIGYEAAQMLDEQLQGKALHPPRRLLAPRRLIVRDSTDVFLCDDPLVKDAMQYIAAHCRKTVKVEDVAQALNTSESTLRRRFEQVVGRQVKDEIARLRTERVKLLLTETAMPLSQIAEDFGFSSAGQFTRYFTRAAGMTPSEYRKRYAAMEEANAG